MICKILRNMSENSTEITYSRIWNPDQPESIISVQLDRIDLLAAPEQNNI